MTHANILLRPTSFQATRLCLFRNLSSPHSTNLFGVRSPASGGQTWSAKAHACWTLGASWEWGRLSRRRVSSITLISSSHTSQRALNKMTMQNMPRSKLCNWFITRAYRKSQVGPCLCFCTADFWSSYESVEQKPKHFLTWDFYQLCL